MYNYKDITDWIKSYIDGILNDSDVAIDANYVHTDNNYTNDEKNKLAGIEENANRYVLPSDVLKEADIGSKVLAPNPDIVVDPTYRKIENISDLDDVSTVVPSIGDRLIWNGTTWTPEADPFKNAYEDEDKAAVAFIMDKFDVLNFNPANGDTIVYSTADNRFHPARYSTEGGLHTTLDGGYSDSTYDNTIDGGNA